jgi:DNA repair protein RAD16
MGSCRALLQLIRLRQAVDHPYLVVHSNTASNTAADAAHDAAAAAAGGRRSSAAAAAGDASFLLPGQYQGEDEELHPDAVAMRAAGGDAAAAAAGSNGGSSGGGGRLTCADDGCCGLCHDPREDGVTAGCGHSFCRTCVVEYIDAVTRVSDAGYNQSLQTSVGAKSSVAGLLAHTSG